MNRVFRYGLFLSKKERDILAELAQLEGGLSKAAVLRRLIHQAAEARGVYQKEHQESSLTSGLDNILDQIHEDNP